MTRWSTSCDECGWSGGPYRSRAQADYAYSRHSCSKWSARAAAAARAAAREAAADRTPRPCHHKRARHEHATRACYILDGCRCRPCADAAAAYERRRTRMVAYGRSDMVDAQPVRDHVEALRRAGVGLKRVAMLSGVAHGALSRLVYGEKGRPRSRRVRRATASAVLAVQPDGSALSPGALVDGTGTRRRLQALACLGWTVHRLQEHTGCERQRLDQAMNGGRVRRSTAVAVRDAYERLWNTRPPATTRGERSAAGRAVARARRAGWAPPMAWDDIDDPSVVPAVSGDGAGAGYDWAAVERVLSGERLRLHRADRLEATRRLNARGWVDSRIAAQLGVSARQVLRDRKALGLPQVHFAADGSVAS